MPPRPPSDSRHPARENFLHPVFEEGAIRLSDERRTAALPVEFIRALHDGLLRELGENAHRTFYAAGYEWALQEMILLSRRLRGEMGNGGNLDVWQMDARLVLEAWWAQFTAAGWGAWTLDLTTQSTGITFVEVRNSATAAKPLAAVTSGRGEPACHLYAGLFAGALSFFERAETHAVEIQCAALGHPSCRFVIGPGSQIDAVESWRRQGASAEEIRRRLT